MKPPYVERSPSESRKRQLRILLGEGVLFLSVVFGLLRLDAFGRSSAETGASPNAAGAGQDTTVPELPP